MHTHTHTSRPTITCVVYGFLRRLHRRRCGSALTWRERDDARARASGTCEIELKGEDKRVGECKGESEENSVGNECDGDGHGGECES